MSGTTLLTLDGGYWVGRGRAELLDARTFGQDAEPLLEVKGSLTYFQVDDVTLLGPDWLLIGRADWYAGWPAEFRALSTARRGFIDFELDDPATWDYELTSDHAGGRVAHVGDRDGDGAVDLAVSLNGYATFFFPELTSGHVADAPEQWDHGGTESTGDILHGAADLDGDGRDDAWIASTSSPGATDAPYSGRVYLAPARGPGVHLVEETAPAEIRGETIMDWTGFSTATGDLDGDGQVDLVVGAGGNYQLARHPGKVLAYLGPLSGVYTVAEADGLWVGEALDDHAGNAVEVGDFDGSGLADIAIGALFADAPQGENAGRVYVLLDPLAP